MTEKHSCMSALASAALLMLAFAPRALGAGEDDDWTTIQNGSQGYTLRIPTTAVARRYDPEGILHIGLSSGHQVLTIRAYDNPGHLSAAEWASAWLPNGAMKVGDELGPTVPVIRRERVRIGGQRAETFDLAGPVSRHRRTIVARADQIYLIVHPLGEAQNEPIFEQIVSTFDVEESIGDIGIEVVPPESTETIPTLSVPYYSQRDPRWVCDQLGTCNCNGSTCTTATYTTIGDAGCFITAQAMIFEYYTAEHFVTPVEYDTCLTDQGGYATWAGCGDCLGHYMPHSACRPGSVTYVGKSTDRAVLDEDLRNQSPAMARVVGSEHWVVITGKDNGMYRINDPYYSRTELASGEIVHFLRYQGPSQGSKQEGVQVNMAVFDPGGGPRLYQGVRGTDGIVYTRYTADGESWTATVAAGTTLDAVNMMAFDPGDGPRLYQAVRGVDNGVYTRYTADGDTWMGWVQNGSTLSAVSMAVFDPGDGPRLYQAIRDEEEVVRTRYSGDGEHWTDWVSSGTAMSAVSMVVFDPGNGPRLYQAYRGQSDGVYSRYTTDGENWTSWARDGIASGAVSMAVFDPGDGPRLYQTVKGHGDDLLTRYSQDGVAWTGWVGSGSTSSDVGMAIFDPGNGPRLYRAVRGKDDSVAMSYTKDGVHWSSWQKTESTFSVVSLTVFDPGDGDRLYRAFVGPYSSVTTHYDTVWTRSGATLDGVNMAVFDPGDGDRLYQAVRRENDQILIRFTTDAENWSGWERINIGATLNRVTLAVFDPGDGPRLYQAVRGGNTYIYTSYTSNGEDWAWWAKADTTLDAINFAVFDPGEGARLYLAARGLDGGVLTRMTKDGDNWTSWVKNGFTLGEVTLAVYDPGTGSRLYQAARGLDGLVSFRHTLDGENWTGWAVDMPTLSAVSMITFDPGDGLRLYQVVRGTDDSVYTRHTSDGDSWTSWVDGGAALSAINLAVFDRGDGPRLYQAARGPDGGVSSRHTLDGDNWTAWTQDRSTLSTVGMAVFDPGDGTRFFQSIRGSDGGVWTRYTPSHLTREDNEIVSHDGRLTLRAPLRDVYVQYSNLGAQNASKPGTPAGDEIVMVSNAGIGVLSMDGSPITIAHEITAELSIDLPSTVKPASAEIYGYDPQLEVWEELDIVGRSSVSVAVEIHDFSQFAIFGELWEVQINHPVVLR